LSLVRHLILDVAAARARFLEMVGKPSPAQAVFRPAPDAWSITDNIEHITLAEQGGINSIWKALAGARAGTPVWTGTLVHAGLNIEKIIATTWKEREQVPATAAPKWGGPAEYWISALRSVQSQLDALGAELERAEGEGIDLAAVVYPHVISGPLDVQQRLEFLRFHLDRHRGQVERIRQHADFPR
jgi:hypothetical protein